MTEDRYEGLKKALEKEKFPLDFTLKLIGKNTADFRDGLLGLEKRYGLGTGVARPSSEGNKVSVTYTFVADSPNRVVELYREAAGIKDLVIIL